MPKWFNSTAMTVLGLRGFELESFEYRSSPVHYVVGGPRGAPTMAVLPGFGDNIFSWTLFLTRYARRFRVYGLDFPGFTGKSPHPPGEALRFDDQDLVAEKFLVETVKRADLLVGNSMGGWLSLRMAARHPARIGHVVALNPAGIAPEEADGKRIRALYDIDSYRDYLRFMRHLWHRIPLAFYPASLLGFYQQLSREPIFRTFLETIEPHHYLDETLPSIRPPISVIWGESDTLLEQRMGRLIASRAPNARFHLVPRAGHMPQVEQPREVYRIIDAVLPKNRPSSATRPSP